MNKTTFEPGYDNNGNMVEISIVDKKGVQSEKGKGIPEFIQTQTGIALKMQEEIAEKEDAIIRQALIDNGFNPNNLDFIRDNFEVVSPENESIVHYFYHYGKPDEKRIISIEKSRNIEYRDGSIDNKIMATLSHKYY
jgi:hypothetical protein